MARKESVNASLYKEKLRKSPNTEPRKSPQFCLMHNKYNLPVKFRCTLFERNKERHKQSIKYKKSSAEKI
jgi:hypothetical protein